MMDDPNITMEEYIKLQVEKAQRRGRTFNWKTATYGKIYCDNLVFFADFEADFSAIVHNDALTSNDNVSPEPTISIYNAIKTDFDFSISFSDFDDEDYTFICDKDSFSYKLIPVNNLKPEPVNDHVEINTELCSKNIDIKPIDSVDCISNDTTHVESDECLETNHDRKSELSETIDTELFTHDIERTKTYEDYESELNNEVGEPYVELPGMVRVGYMTYFQDYECYDNLTDSSLKEEALKQKAIYEKSWLDSLKRPPRDQRHLFLRFEGLEYIDADIADIEGRLRNGRACNNNDNQEKEEQHKEGLCNLFNDPAQEPLVCMIRRFDMIKYSFGQEEEYVSIK
ncbi:hypothetical protein Tco_0157901 [Tanacetum coccineum]